LNDPVSVAAVFHLAIEASVADNGPLARATLNVLRTVLDDRSEAEVWAGSDLAYFGPAWRQARIEAQAPYPSPSLLSVADRMAATPRRRTGRYCLCHGDGGPGRS